MSSKNAEPSAAAPPTWSITSRLVILFAAAAIIILSAATGLLYVGLERSLEEQSRNYIRDEIRILRALLLHSESLEEIEREIAIEYETLEYLRHFVRVLDEEGNVLIETPGMGRLVPDHAFPVPKESDVPYGKGDKWRTPDDHVYILKALRTEIGEFQGSHRTLQVALDVTPKEIVLTEYRQELFLVVLFGVAASLLAAVAISRRGLRPLRQITALTSRITAAHLDERLQSRHWPGELRELSLSFDRMLDRLEDAFDRLSHFASNMAHEFRTPLNNLVGEAEVALTRDRSPEEYHHLLESNLEEYRRLGRVVEGLLFLARAEGNGCPVAREEFDLQAAAAELADYYHPLAEENDLELHVECAAGLTLRADATLFRRAVGNLLLNAIHYTPRGGRVDLTGRRGDGNGIEIAVSDSGCGITGEDLPRLFDRFYRVDGNRERHPKGFGLGLPIVRSIMELHGGRVAITSQPGNGTVVTLYFPVNSEQ